jgi:tetratricopeptide (TPR) repeat protein
VNLFFESSTRTSSSFELAAKRLSADVMSIKSSGSAVDKGESLKDTAITIGAYDPDVVVIRHPHIGAPHLVARCTNGDMYGEPRPAILLSTEDDPEIDDTIGWTYFRKGDYSTAVRYFENAVSRSKDPRMRYHLAMAHFGAGNRAQGEKTLAAAEALDPNLPEAAQARTMAQKRQ